MTCLGWLLSQTSTQPSLPNTGTHHEGSGGWKTSQDRHTGRLAGDGFCHQPPSIHQATLFHFQVLWEEMNSLRVPHPLDPSLKPKASPDPSMTSCPWRQATR